MIPKRIFYVWGAGEPKKRDVEVCMQSWRQIMPDCEIVEINQDSKKYFDWERHLAENKWFREVCGRKMWAYIADYVRVSVLRDNGGIYLDTDVSLVRPLDEFLAEPAFVGMQDSAEDGHDDFTEPAVLGAEKGNKFLDRVFGFYSNDGDGTIWTTPVYTMPEIFRRFLEKNYGPGRFPAKPDQKIIRYKDITVYPERYFIPFRCFSGGFSPECVEKDTHAVHWFGGSWLDKKTRYFLDNKHIPGFVGRSRFFGRLAKLVRLIPFVRLEPRKDKMCLLFSFPLVTVRYRRRKKTYKLFGLIPLLSIRSGRKTVFRLLGSIPLLAIAHNGAD
jgi:mannosyltransferase OCH1-like enzyme